MRRGRTPLVFKIIIDHIITMYPKRQASTIERMLRAREITFNKGELRKIILFLHDVYEGLAPSKKKDLPDELPALRKIFMDLVDKSEAEPHLMVNVYAANLAESDEGTRRGGVNGSLDGVDEGAGGVKLKSKVIMMRRSKSAGAIKPRKRKLKEVAATDSEEDTSSSSERSDAVNGDSNMSADPIPDGNWARSTYWSGNEHAPNGTPSDVTGILSSSPFQLFTTSPGLGLGSGSLGSGNKIGMPPPLSIPPSAMAQQQQQSRSGSSPTSNGSSTTDESLGPDDTDFELLKTLLVDSPGQSHCTVAENGNIVRSNPTISNSSKVAELTSEETTKKEQSGNDAIFTSTGDLSNLVFSTATSTDNLNDTDVSEVDKKVSLCYRAKRVLDSWEGWHGLEHYIATHREEFKFLKDFNKETIEKYIQEFKRFLTLKAINEDINDTAIAASIFIDKLWLTLIQKPSAYQSLCHALLPAAKMTVMDRNPKNKPIGLIDPIFTMNEYSHVYGVPPSSEFWDSSFTTTEPRVNSNDNDLDLTTTYKEVRFKTCFANDMVLTDISALKSISEILDEYRKERGVGKDHVKNLVVIYDGVRVNVADEMHANVTLGQLLGSPRDNDYVYNINVFAF